MHQIEPAFLPFGQFRNPSDYFPRHNQVPVLRPHPELEGTRYELLLRHTAAFVAMLRHIVQQDPAVGLLVIAANVDDISRGLQHDSDAVQLRMTGVKDVAAHVKPNW